MPIGEIGKEALHYIYPDTPAVMSRTQQKMLITQLVKQWTKNIPMGAGQSAQLAFELLRLLDEITEEEITLDKLHHIVPENYSEHWQLTLDFLKIITEAWPDLINNLSLVDPIHMRQLALDAQIQYWQKHPPKHPVIAAGSTGSIPATARLLNAIANMENGYVILPGLDQTLDEQSWEELEPSHPQYGLKQLLEQMQLQRSDVLDWKSTPPTPRHLLLSHTMQPANQTHKWHHADNISPEATKNLVRIDTQTPEEEAQTIALILRDTLEGPKKNAALVTHDRTLARYVSTLLKQWDITINDSEGTDLAHTVPAVFMRLLLEASLPTASPLAILSLLKHPLCLGQHRSTSFRHHVRTLEKQLFRGVRHTEGLLSLYNHIQHSDLHEWFDDIITPLKPLLTQLQKPQSEFTHILQLHLEACEALSREEMLWNSDEGKQLKSILDEISLHADYIGPVAPTEYLQLIFALLSGQQFRPSYGHHPRLHILSPMEARMQQFDTIILSGLNEGSWPPNASQDPWMNRAIRQQVGLPPPERLIGLAAHDFVQLTCNNKVYLTRSRKNKGVQTIPSRWLMRLNQVMQIHQLNYTKDKPWLEWARQWQETDTPTPCTPPAPTPSAELRPTHYSASLIEQLMRNPYGVYASHILKLKPLDPIDQDPGAAEFGNFIHRALELFHNSPHAPTYDRLIKCAQDVLRTLDIPKAITTLWWPRFKRIAHWIIKEELKRNTSIAAIHTENKGHYIIGDFTISARADRIEQTDQGLGIIDYKTGTLPTNESIRLGISPQMVIEAIIAKKDGYALSNTTLSSIEYWRLSGSNPAGEIRYIKDIETLCDVGEVGIETLCTEFSRADTPYLHTPRSQYGPSFNPYTHLAREKEWKT
jgi:ATP-dependent helicase/nuclease subunit B